MKLMIASDIHGSAFYCKQLMEAYKQENPDKLLLLGDLLYHGPRNDLPKEYAPKQVIEMLNAIYIICRNGTHMGSVFCPELYFPHISVCRYKTIFCFCHARDGTKPVWRTNVCSA